MVVRFTNGKKVLATRFYEFFAPNIGDEVTLEGDSYKVVGRKLDLDHNEVLIKLEESNDEREI